MDSKTINASHRKLFLQGGRLDILYRQVKEDADKYQAIKFGQGLELIKECPCGCGLKNDVCPARSDFIRRLNDEIPF
jgi:hypothetical protein